MVKKRNILNFSWKYLRYYKKNCISKFSLNSKTFFTIDELFMLHLKKIDLLLLFTELVHFTYCNLRLNTTWKEVIQCWNTLHTLPSCMIDLHWFVPRCDNLIRYHDDILFNFGILKFLLKLLYRIDLVITVHVVVSNSFCLKTGDSYFGNL